MKIFILHLNMKLKWNSVLRRNNVLFRAWKSEISSRTNKEKIATAVEIRPTSRQNSRPAARKRRFFPIGSSHRGRFRGRRRGLARLTAVCCACASRARRRGVLCRARIRAETRRSRRTRSRSGGHRASSGSCRGRSGSPGC